MVPYVIVKRADTDSSGQKAPDPTSYSTYISSGSLQPYEPIGSLNLKLWKFALQVVPDRTSEVSQIWNKF
jgi:hypothetical protein